MCVGACVCVRVHVRVHVCARAWVCMYIYEWGVRVRACECVCACLLACVCMCACVRGYVCTSTCAFEAKVSTSPRLHNQTLIVCFCTEPILHIEHACITSIAYLTLHPSTPSQPITTSNSTHTQSPHYPPETTKIYFNPSMSVLTSLPCRCREDPRHCPICLSHLSTGRAIFTTSCSHSYHYACLQAMYMGGGVHCPVCAEVIKEPPILLQGGWVGGWVHLWVFFVLFLLFFLLFF